MTDPYVPNEDLPAENRIVRAMSRMPYFPLTRFGTSYFATHGPTRDDPMILSLPHLAEALEAFAEVLRKVGDESRP